MVSLGAEAECLALEEVTKECSYMNNFIQDSFDNPWIKEFHSIFDITETNQKNS